jgi:diguanylate cyclase (GGDEF)-like protein
LGQVTVVASIILAAVFALGAWALLHEAGMIRRLADDTRSTLLPAMLERQRAVVNLERLKQYGNTVLESGEPRVRADTVVVFSYLINHPALQGDQESSALAHHASEVVANLAKARDEGDALRAAGQRAAADEVERHARQDWRDTYAALDALSESLFVSAGDLGTQRSQTFGLAARHVELMVGAAYIMLFLALVGGGLLVHQLLLKPILLTTAALDREETSHSVKLPASSVGEIDLFYRSVERIATALSEIEDAHRQARAAQAELRRLASIDELTGVANRRWFTAMASRELERCRRFNHQLALLMIDIDHFKRVNDTHGHAVGDEVLKAFTRVLEGNLRSVDLLGRLGGEEFAVVLPESDHNAAAHTAERLRAAVEGLDFPFEDGSGLRITTSVGIAILSTAGETLDSLLARADSALYAAKGEGRNRVVVS